MLDRRAKSGWQIKGLFQFFIIFQKSYFLKYWEMHEWVLDYCIKYPTFKPPFLILVIATYQKSCIPGKLITRLFLVLKIAIFLINLTDFSPGKFGQWEISPQLIL